jgi:hypothetical protein
MIVRAESTTRTQSSHDSSSFSLYISSQPRSESGTLRIWLTRTHKCRKCIVPAMSHAEVLCGGRGTLWGKSAISNAILEGIDVILRAIR